MLNIEIIIDKLADKSLNCLNTLNHPKKAFAKFCGSYRGLIAGHPVRGLSYLTGGMSIRMIMCEESLQQFAKATG